MPFKPKIKGDTWNGLEINIDNPDLDFTDCIAIMQFRRGKKNGSLAFEYKTQDGTIVRNGSVFKMQPRILNFEPNDYFFYLQITFSNGSVKTFIDDKITISQDVRK